MISTKIVLTENYSKNAVDNLRKHLKTLGYVGILNISKENIPTPLIESDYSEQMLMNIIQSPEKWDKKVYEISESTLEHLLYLTAFAKTDTEYNVHEILTEIKNKG